MRSAATAKPDRQRHDASLSVHSGGVMRLRSRSAGPPLSAATSSAATSAATSASAYNSCRDRHCPKCQSLARAEWLGEPAIRTSRHPVFPRGLHACAATHCRHRLPEQGEWSTASCSGPAARPCAPSRPIPSTWVPRSASSRSSTRGVRTRFTIPTCIASSPAAGSPRTARGGLPAAQDFFLPVRVLSRLFRRLFLEYLREGLRCGSTGNSFHPSSSCRLDAFLAPPVFRPQVRVGGLRQTTVRRTRKQVLRLCRPLHPSRCHFQRSTARPRDGESNFAGKTIDTAAGGRRCARRRGVHSSVSDSCSSVGLSAYSILRLSRQSLSRAEAGAVPPIAAHALASEPKSEAKVDYRDRYEQLTGTSLRTCPVCHIGHMVVIETFDGLETQPPIRDTSSVLPGPRISCPDRPCASKRCETTLPCAVAGCHRAVPCAGSTPQQLPHRLPAAAETIHRVLALQECPLPQPPRRGCNAHRCGTIRHAVQSARARTSAISRAWSAPGTPTS